MNHVDAEKRVTRDYIRGLLREIPNDEKARRSETICLEVSRLDEFNLSRVAMFYMPTRLEVNVRPLIELALKLGKTVSVPLITGDGLMEAARIENLDEMEKGEYGVERPKTRNIIPAESIDLIITPGLAFDKNAGRLGKGGGYYDRYLKRTSAVSVAVAFSDQVTDRVPATDTDAKMDILVTERFVLRFKRI